MEPEHSATTMIAGGGASSSMLAGVVPSSTIAPPSATSSSTVAPTIKIIGKEVSLDLDVQEWFVKPFLSSLSLLPIDSCEAHGRGEAQSPSFSTVTSILTLLFFHRERTRPICPVAIVAFFDWYLKGLFYYSKSGFHFVSALTSGASFHMYLVDYQVGLLGDLTIVSGASIVMDVRRQPIVLLPRHKVNLSRVSPLLLCALSLSVSHPASFKLHDSESRECSVFLIISHSSTAPSFLLPTRPLLKLDAVSE